MRPVRLTSAVTLIALLTALPVLLGVQLTTTSYRADVVLTVGSVEPDIAQRDYYQVAVESLAADYARMDAVVRRDVPAGAIIEVSPISTTRLVRVRTTADDERAAARAASTGATSLLELVADMTAGLERQAALGRYRRAVEDETRIALTSVSGQDTDADTDAAVAAAEFLSNLARDDAQRLLRHDQGDALLGTPDAVVTAVETPRSELVAWWVVMFALFLTVTTTGAVRWLRPAS